MTAPFKSFLQGLLCKDCNKRLSWPELARHDFVKEGVKIPDVTASIMEPLTATMTEEQLKKKLEQQKAKAPPPGTSRILSRATRDNKKNHKPSITPSPIPNMKSTKTTDKKPAKDETKKESAPTPVAAQAETKAASVVKQSLKPVDELQPEADDWQNLAEDLIPESNFEHCEKMIQDETFLARLKQRLVYSKGLMFEGKLEGAAAFREICKILCNLLSIQFNDDNELDESTIKLENGKELSEEAKEQERYAVFRRRLQALENFCHHLEIPQFFLEIVRQLMGGTEGENKSLREQPWFNQIELDVVLLLHSYFSSHLSMLAEVSEKARASYLRYTTEFLKCAEFMLNQENDVDLRIKERTMIVSSLEIYLLIWEYR